MNTLKQAFTEHRESLGLTLEASAKQIGYSPEHLCRVLAMKTPCGKMLADKLEHWSGGKVPFVVCMRPQRIRDAA